MKLVIIDLFINERHGMVNLKSAKLDFMDIRADKIESIIPTRDPDKVEVSDVNDDVTAFRSTWNLDTKELSETTLSILTGGIN